MFLALGEIRKARWRFVLLTGAVGLLVFLILFVQALTAALIGQFIGAIDHQSADVLVYSQQARKNLEGSVVPPGTVAQVARVRGWRRRVHSARGRSACARTANCATRYLSVTRRATRAPRPPSPRVACPSRVSKRSRARGTRPRDSRSATASSSYAVAGLSRLSVRLVTSTTRCCRRCSRRSIPMSGRAATPTRARRASGRRR